MADKLGIRLLGGFAVEVGGVPVPDDAWRLRKARAVVKLLALNRGRGLHPERLQHLLWPERDAASASNNLRQALYQARRALTAAGADGAAVLIARGDLLVLDGAEVDVAAFEAAAEAAEHDGGVEALEAAVARYGGELLPEDPYEPWAAEPRRALADRHLALLEALAEAVGRAAGPAASIEPLRRAIAAEPLHEPAHRALMRALDGAGRRQQALEHFGRLKETLERETAGEPEEATRALYRELLAAAAPEPDSAIAPAAPAAEPEPEPPGAPPPGAVSPPGNLPWQATSFVGRGRELAELDRVLAGARLVTLTGPGGAGKTRLALEAAGRRSAHHADGAWIVRLASVGEGELVVPTAAAALGVDLDARRTGPEALAARLADRDLLLVLDNCEHLTGAAGALATAVLAAAPSVRILATSRAPLRVPGEVDWRVPSLKLADPGDLPELDALAATDAVRLFCDRAAAASARFVLGADNAHAVAEVCWRVDGLPLAIELAAARVGALSPSQIAERLGDALRVLRAARPSDLTRQQTLEATLDWSHELLSEDERRLFRRLSVFAGGFDLEAAEWVTKSDMLDLAGLVDQSLALAEEGGEAGAYRYRLLEPIRQYAARRLTEARETSTFAARHARRYAALAAAAGGRVTDFEQAQVDRLERDHDNLRAALAWTLAHQPQDAPGFAAGVAGLWLLRLHLREGARWLVRALEAAPDPTADRAAALHAHQAIERRRPLEYDLADRLCDEAAEIHRGLGDPREEALALLAHADGSMTRGYLGEAAAMTARATELAEADGDPALRAAVRERAGLLHVWRHEVEPGVTHLTATLDLLTAAGPSPVPCSPIYSTAGLVPVVLDPEARPLLGLEETSMHFRRVPPSLSRAFVLCSLAAAHRLAGHVAEARTALEEALAIALGHADALSEGIVRMQRGHLERDAGDLAAATAWLSRGLEIRRGMRDVRGVMVGLNALGVVLGRAGDRERAERVLAEPLRMAEAHVDGPGLAGCCIAHADVAIHAGDPATAHHWLEQALERFSEPTDLPVNVSWMHLAAGHDALAFGDRAAVDRHLERSRAAFAITADATGVACCDALERRSRCANGVLTAR